MAAAPQDPVVVVGNGGAAVHACRALRDHGHRGRVVVVGDHGEAPYNPMLTPCYVAGRIDREGCFPFPPGVLEALGVESRLGEPVVALDAVERTVTLAGGSRLRYESCLVATGASPIVPATPGLHGPGVFVLRTMGDADRLRRALAAGPERALVLGASMVGLKVAELLHELGVRVVLADLAAHVLSLAAHQTCARLIEGHMSAAGIDLRMETRLTALQRAAGGGLLAVLDPGEPLAVDLVVVAVGVRPNLDFVDRGQVDVDVGLLVDDHLETSAAGLYAAGDVAQALNLASGRREVVGLWANACLQGRTAGRNMAGDSETYPGSLPCNVIHVMDMTFAGVADASSKALVERLDDEAGTYCRVAGDAGGPSGANLLNDCAGAGIVRHAVAKGARRSAGAGGRAAGEGPDGSEMSAGTGLAVPQRAWAGFCDRLFEYGVSGVVSGTDHDEEEA